MRSVTINLDHLTSHEVLDHLRGTVLTDIVERINIGHGIPRTHLIEAINRSLLIGVVFDWQQSAGFVQDVVDFVFHHVYHYTLILMSVKDYQDCCVKDTVSRTSKNPKKTLYKSMGYKRVFG